MAHKHIRLGSIARAVLAAQVASTTLRESEPSEERKPRPAGRRVRRSIMLLILGGVAALVLSKDLRSKLLDTVFGSEEEFTYSSTTAPATPAPTDPVAA